MCIYIYIHVYTHVVVGSFCQRFCSSCVHTASANGPRGSTASSGISEYSRENLQILREREKNRRTLFDNIVLCGIQWGGGGKNSYCRIKKKTKKNSVYFLSRRETKIVFFSSCRHRGRPAAGVTIRYFVTRRQKNVFPVRFKQACNIRQRDIYTSNRYNLFSTISSNTSSSFLNYRHNIRDIPV